MNELATAIKRLPINERCTQAVRAFVIALAVASTAYNIFSMYEQDQARAMITDLSRRNSLHANNIAMQQQTIERQRETIENMTKELMTAHRQLIGCRND